MPSPTSRTLPTSARSCPPRKLLISSWRTELISSTLNFIPLLGTRSRERVCDRKARLPARHQYQSAFNSSRTLQDLPRGAIEQRGFEPHQLRRGAAVEFLVAHLHHHAGDQALVDA